MLAARARAKEQKARIESCFFMNTAPDDGPGGPIADRSGDLVNLPQVSSAETEERKE